MLPDSFIVKPFTPAVHGETEKPDAVDTVNSKLLALETKILNGTHYAGQSRNRLLEETDNHIRALIVCN